MIVVSLWVHRPEEFPAAADYPAMLKILERSCRRLGLQHFCLTDRKTRESPLWPVGVTPWAGIHVPEPLMNACTELQALWMNSVHAAHHDTLFVGADCIMKRKPVYPETVDMAVTYRMAEVKYPINTGAVFVRSRAQRPAAKFFRRVAARCGPVWCDDQRAVRAELEPMPRKHGEYWRADMRVGFMPMVPYNVLPRNEHDAGGNAYMVHFRGRKRKTLLFNWAQRWGFDHD